ncbi:MAG: UDP-N-acetylmuramoyl-L-alanine--D-glutamate ligase [Planctomycetota bacterium]|jgi:UDP-N-acetylmuramoylalanine--D-glutamate ligase
MLNTRYDIRNTQYDFAGKRVLIMGLGRFGGGVDAAKFAAKAGAKVIITDLASRRQLIDSIKQLEEFPDIEFHLGSHNAIDFEQADIIIANPAVPDDNEFLEIARRNNKFVTSQINIFFQFCPAQIIGITGANGKSTTAALTAHLLRSASDEHVWLSGNIGNQLAQVPKAPTVALLTNLTPNHLDRYGTFADYCAAKESIFRFQKLDDQFPAVSIFNAEDKVGAEWFEKYKQDAGRNCITFSADDVSEQVRASFGLPGRANLSNLAAAVAIARHFGIDDDQLKNSLPQFKALPHRLELVAQINGISWYNDSKATTPESTIVAIEAFEQPTIIIAGGYDKNVAFDGLGRKIAKDAKVAILIGQTAEKIAEAIKVCPQNQTRIEFAKSLSEAVQLGNRLAESGDVVLLSPACASYDMFDNFEQRGQEFCGLVRQISN